MSKTSSFRQYLPALILVVLVFAVYLPSLDIYLRGDDFEWLGASYQGWNQPGQLFSLINHFFRPLVKLSYLLDYTFFKTSPLGYNLTTLLFHFINLYLLYRLMLLLFKREIPAFLVTFCFGVSAMYSEVTLWSAGRPDSILLMFVLGVLILLTGRDSSAAAGKSRLWWPGAWVILLTLLAVGSKETWILLPVLAFVLLWIAGRKHFKEALQQTFVLFAMLAVYVFVFMLLPVLSGTRSPAAYAGTDIGESMRKFGFLLFKYTGLSSYFSAAAWQYLLIAIVLGLLAWIIIKSKNWLALTGLMWLLITMAISLPIHFAPSRYNYLPLIGFWLMVIALLDAGFTFLVEKYSLKQPLKIALIAVPLLFYAGQQIVMLQWEIKDYHRWGETHKKVVDMYRDVSQTLPHDRPLIFIDQGTRKAVQEAADNVQGYSKLLFVRETAIWQQIHLPALDNFLGRPFQETLEPVPDNQLEHVLQTDFSVLVFTDGGFFLSSAHKNQVLEYYRQYRTLPRKVEALQWFNR